MCTMRCATPTALGKVIFSNSLVFASSVDSLALFIHLWVARDYSCMLLRVLTFFRMKHAFGVDVGSGEQLENRTLIPASTSTILHPHPLLSQPPFHPKWTLRTGTGTGMCTETVEEKPRHWRARVPWYLVFSPRLSVPLPRFYCEFMELDLMKWS
jgi:hypothetical protein